MTNWKIKKIDACLYLYRYQDNHQNTTFQRNKEIQDLLSLARAHYAEQFKAFNALRLSASDQNIADFNAKSYSTSDISYVIPEGAPSDLTEKCLASIRKFSPGSEIILVSNGQPSLEPARALADKTVDLEMNLRFAAACNRGAMEATRELVSIINNDTEFLDDSPATLAAAVGVKGDIAACYSNRAKPPQGDIPYERVPKTDLFPDAVVGVCMVMRTDLYRALGGFDSRLYTYEDDDLSLRARALGKKCVVVGGTYVAHERHATFRKRGEDVHAVMAENRKIFEKKHPRIRVIAISKDEETSIRGFFEQFSGITRDWCLLDTGSTDRTIEEACAIGVRVEQGPFEDFAQARNEALKRFAGDAEWVLMLDPDERLDAHTLAHLKETFFRTPYDILLSPLHAVNPDGSGREFVPKPFAFRNRPEIRWAFKVHEKLVGSKRQALVVNAQIRHMLELHGAERRAASGAMYERLQREEPYFTDPDYRRLMREEWPILDYDLMYDPRIVKFYIGPLVSVVIPTYRRRDLLSRAVQSVLSQNYDNIEVVVIGDACPDLSVPSCSDDNVRIFNLPSNHGAGGAAPRNYGIMLSAGEFVAYLDDDNYWDPNHVSSLHTAIRNSEASFAFSSMRVNGKDLGFTELRRGSIDTSCVIHRKDLVRKYGWWKGRDEVGAGYAHDFEFFNRFVAGGERWAATGLATVDYNVETCGQREFIEKLAEAKA